MYIMFGCASFRLSRNVANLNEKCAVRKNGLIATGLQATKKVWLSIHHAIWVFWGWGWGEGEQEYLELETISLTKSKNLC